MFYVLLMLRNESLPETHPPWLTRKTKIYYEREAENGIFKDIARGKWIKNNKMKFNSNNNIKFFSFAFTGIGDMN